jgi:four helix bundle protein
MPFRFESLEIWHMARGYSQTVYSATAKFPRHEDYGLRSQMKRAVNSIGLNIAEGSAKGSNKAFDYHLEVAIGSTFEVAAGSFLAVDNTYISSDEQKELYGEGQKLARSINAFRNTLSHE